MKQHIPNILTYARLVLCLVMFGAFALVTMGLSGKVSGLSGSLLASTILWSFVIAAVTDFFDGYLARRWDVVSTTGAILDPIADKVLVCGALLGLCAVSGTPDVLIPSGVILFREFAVSAMREVLAPKGIKLPVTFLAKTKTSLQLVAITLVIVFAFWPLWYGTDSLARVIPWRHVAEYTLYIAALITVWTGVEYAIAARKALAPAK